MALTKISTGGVKDDAASQAKIADEAIDEARLQVSNTGTNGEFLQKQSGNTGGLTWAAANQYTHPNHSGEVTSTGDGATVIASNIVDEDNLKISNTGTNGQYLQKQSGNTGGLTWADVTVPPAGNTVDLVADGDIAAGKAVIIKSNGKAAQVASPVSAITSAISSTNGRLTIDEDNADYNFGLVWDELRDRLIASWERSVDGQAAVITISTALGNNSMSDGTHESYENSNCNGSALCYDPDTNQYLAVYRAGNQSDYGGSRLGTTTGGSYNAVTWGTEVFLNSHRGENYNLCYDTANNKFVAAYYNEDDQRRVYCAVGTVSGTSVSWGTPVKLDNNWKVSNDGGTKQLAICYDSNAERVVVSWRMESNDQGFVAVCTVSGTSISQTGYGTLNAADTDNIQCCFDSNANKTIFVYRDEGNSNRITVRSASISGNTITFGNEEALGGGNPSDNTGHLCSIGFDPATNGFWVAYYNANNFFRASNGIINGTGFTWWTEDMTLTNDGMHNLESRNNVKVCALGSHGKVAIIGSNASESKDPDIFIIETKAATPNFSNSHKNFLGFAEDAISDGNTGTIKLTGNVVGNQSGLTAGLTYHVEDDGTLDNNWDGMDVGLLALSSTSGLIIRRN